MEDLLEDLLELKRIGVIVDSGSFHNLMRIIGIGQVNLKKLLEVISREVSQTIQAPVTVDFAQYITAAENPDRFKKRTKSAGFQFISTDHCVKDSDDEEMNRRIVLTDPNAIDVLIVVTADVLDYVESLETKRDQHIKIFVAAITASESDGYPPLSIHSRQIIKENQYTLIDLGNYKEDLLITEWVDQVRPHAIRADVESGSESTTEESKTQSNAGHLNLHEWINARCIYLYSQISVYAGRQDLADIQCASKEISFLLDLEEKVHIPYGKVQREEEQNIVPNERKKKPYSPMTVLQRSERHEKIFSALRTHKSASISMLLQEISGVAAHALLRDLRGLRASGLIQSTGKKNGTRYMLATTTENGVISDS